jgi:hypothetical protein
VAYVILLVAGIAIVTFGVWCAIRTVIGRRMVGAVIGAPSRPLSRPLLRAALALAATLLAVVAAASLALDQSMALQPAASLFFLAEAAVAAAIAFAIARQRLAPARVLAAIVGVIAIVGLASSPLSLARSACACARPAGPPYVPPTLLGMDGAAWATVALVGVPVLLVVTLASWRRSS